MRRRRLLKVAGSLSLRGFLVSVPLLGLLGCGGASAPAAPIPTPTPTLTLYDGTWVGCTAAPSGGGFVQFLVRGNQMTGLAFDCGCAGVPVPDQPTYSPGGVILIQPDGSFNYVGSFGAGSGSFAGRFPSASTASGAFSASDPHFGVGDISCSCNGPWSATKCPSFPCSFPANCLGA